MAKQKILKELARKCKWKDVQKAILYWYPDQKRQIEAYKPVFEKIKKATFKKTKKTEYITIVLTRYEDDEWYHAATNLYSLSFRDWKEIANLKIGKQTLSSMRTVDIVAHLLWEITYLGFTKKERKVSRDEVFGKLKNIYEKLQNENQ